MIYLKNTSHYEEIIVKNGIVAIARRMLGKDRYNKEFIMDVTDLTEEGYIEAIKRKVIFDCAKIFCERYTIEGITEKLTLNEEEVEELIKYKEEQKRDKIVKQKELVD